MAEKTNASESRGDRGGWPVTGRFLWAGCAVGATLVALTTLVALIVSPAPWHDDAVYVFGGLAPALVGAVIVLRKPDNSIAKLLVVIGSVWLVGEASRIYLWMSRYVDVPTTDLAAWLVGWIFAPAWFLLPVLLAVFPSGTVGSTWLRRTVRVYTVFMVAVTVLSSVAPQDHGEASGDYLAGFDNPFALAALSSFDDSPAGRAVGAGLDGLSGAAVLVLGLITVVDLIRRWRRSEGAERLQMRAFALGALVMVLLLVVSSAMAAFGSNQLLENLGTTLAVSAPSLAIGVAVLRYRLYQIDRLVSRTVTYALVAGLLAAMFAAIAVGLPQLLGIGEESPLAVAGATLAVAASFNPVRHRIQASVSRRFDRSSYDAQREVDRFSEQLRDLVLVGDVSDAMLSVVAETMRPVGLSLWLADEKESGP